LTMLTQDHVLDSELPQSTPLVLVVVDAVQAPAVQEVAVDVTFTLHVFRSKLTCCGSTLIIGYF
jgi:hypothetical protein